MEGVTALAAGLVGLLVGLGAALAFRVSERADPQPAPARPGLDEGLVRVLAVLQSAAVVLDVDGDVVRASPPSYALGVVRGEEIAHQAIRDLITQVQADGVIRDEELELPRGPLGRGTVVVHVRVAHVGPEHILVLAEDRTEARRVEAVRRDFVVNVSHELKTPVGALALLAETVADAADDPVMVRRFAGRMNIEATRLSALVQEIIELSRLQVAGAMEANTPVPVATIVREAIDQAKTAAAAKQIVLSHGGDDGATVYGDEALLVTALRNLVVNAVSYSPDGSQVGIGVRRAPGDIVEIAVVDQGIGIAPADQGRVFERFYRVDQARSRETGGTGLGLSIVKHVIADHGGDVDVWSELGNGSTFTIRLPAAWPAARTAAQAGGAGIGGAAEVRENHGVVPDAAASPGSAPPVGGGGAVFGGGAHGDSKAERTGLAGPREGA